MSRGEVIQLELNAMGRDGQALGRHEGKVVFVPFGVPGDAVRVRVVEDRRRWSRGELLRVLSPSPRRVEPPCPYFGRCGGCHWQHVDYQEQLAYKRQALVEQLQRAGQIDDPPVLPALGMEEPWFYRNHGQFALTEHGQIGLQAARSHDVVPIEQCLLLHPLLDDLHAALDVDWPELRRLSLRAGINTGEQMVIVETDEDEPPELEVDMPLSCVLRQRDGTDLVLVGRDFYHETLHERPFRVSAGSFFQVNTAQAEELLHVVERYLDPGTDDVLLDVYCGVGTFGLSMQDRVARVIGIEEHPAAIGDAEANAGTRTQ
jgi:23S rRNA (uracil1939-C5)-methyltransferase